MQMPQDHLNDLYLVGQWGSGMSEGVSFLIVGSAPTLDQNLGKFIRTDDSS